jgi:xylan 1,4-beta-xylosidase
MLLLPMLPMLLLAGLSKTAAQPGVPACAAPPHDAYPFCNTSLPLEARVRDLVARVHDADKPGLLTARHHQALSYLGVPAYYWGSNCIHSSMFSNCTEEGRCSTSFPSGPSTAATFDRTLIRAIGGVVGRETRAGFNAKWLDNGFNGAGLDCWGPVINLNRDPRWGRNGEGGAEDPYLMGQLGLAWTRGMQVGVEDPDHVLVAITLKHFVANDVDGKWTQDGVWGSSAVPNATVNRHTVNAKISKHDLMDSYWPAFRDAIREGDAQGIMCSYNSVNGVPTCLDPLQKAARESWGFNGYVTSDSDSIDDAWRTHHYVETAAEASCQAVGNGGCDVDSGNTYLNGLLHGVANESLTDCNMADVDASLFNTFRVRFRLGLFDPPADSPFWKLNVKDDMGTDASKALNLRAALESLVLLRNDDAILPLSTGIDIAVVGPHGDATRDLIQVDTGRICANGYDCVTSPFNALAAANTGGTTTFTAGTGIIDKDTSHIAAAVNAAKLADVVVAAVGITNCGNWWHERNQKQGGSVGDDNSTWSCGDFTAGTGVEFLEGETHDRERLSLPPAQSSLLKAILELGKPTVVILLNGGAVGIEEVMGEPALRDRKNSSPVAVVEAFYPGAQGGVAIAQALFGVANKWGKMPYTIYTPGWEDRHNFLEQDLSTTGRTYRYAPDDQVLVPFGFGLSLTRFEVVLEGIKIAGVPPLTLKTDGTSEDVSVTVRVSNIGGRAGDEVVQVYAVPVAVDPGVSILPRKSLTDFQRVGDIPAGGSTTTTFLLNARNLLLVDKGGNRVAAPGEYTFRFETGGADVWGSSGAEILQELSVKMIGPVVVTEAFPTV